ncbi:facilitated trehalose transporter Tret1-like [Daktulosphaira vitifoliae]|uniref:facilitated trehalose transporter Tret1-like n=1 Tax=Daktulosphaira vitifoliae TaxID=58002 RepID=UPI0021AA78E8|nr:facilitated trehalose transporter Tret1-like [Daktulosphaira vitifoliae]
MKQNNILLLLKLVLCTSIMSIHSFITSSAFIYSSIILAQLKDPSFDIHIDNVQASWIASIPNLVCPIGLILTGIVTDRFGRKRVLQISFVPMIIGWFMLYFAKNFYFILVARVVLGLSYGSGIVVSIYAAEICPTALRPMFLAVTIVYTGFSMLFATLLGIYFSWRILAAIYGVLGLFGALGLFIIPEPPIWLRSRGRKDEAIRAEQWLGLESMSVKEDVEIPIAPPIEQAKLLSWSTYTASNIWKPTVHVIFFIFLQQCSGIHVLMSYSVDVLHDCGVQKDGITVTMYLSIARLIGSLTYFLLSGVKRKTLTIISGLGMFVWMSVIVGYIYEFENTSDTSYNNWLIVAFFLYVYFSMLAMMPIPWSISGEIFPMHVKGIMNAFVQSVGYEILFGATKIYPTLVAIMGIKIVWTFFTSTCLIIVLYGWLLLPETKGKSLDEILIGFESKKIKDKIKNLP